MWGQDKGHIELSITSLETTFVLYFANQCSHEGPKGGLLAGHGLYRVPNACLPCLDMRGTVVLHEQPLPNDVARVARASRL